MSIESTKFASCGVPEEESGKGLGGGMFLYVEDEVRTFILRDIVFEECYGWKGKKVFISGDILLEVVDMLHLNWSMNEKDLSQTNELNGYERTSNETYIVPLVVYLWRNFSGNGFVHGMDGSDFSGCGFSEAPCKTIDKIMKLRYLSSNSFISCSISIMSKSDLIEPFSLNYTSNFKIEGGGNETDVAVKDVSNSEQTSYIICGTSCELLKFAIVIASSVKELRRSLILSRGESLVMSDISLEIRDNEQIVTFCFLTMISGVLICKNINIKGITFFSCGVIEMNGDKYEVSGEVANLSMISVNSGSSNGFIVLRQCSSMRVDNSSIINSIEKNSSIIMVDSSSSIYARNCTFKNCSRESRNGSVFIGNVGSSHAVEFNNCSMEDNSLEEGALGGSVYCKIKENGCFKFDSGFVKNCMVSDIYGLGGGMYLIFQSEEAAYSIRSVVFKENRAFKGANAYVVCPDPLKMIQLNFWKETTTEETIVEDEFWVLDSDNGGEGETMKKFLFPGDKVVLFVDTSGDFSFECGAYNDTKFCKELSFSFKKMIETQYILHIANIADLDGEIVQSTKPLTIRGKNDKSDMSITEKGHLLLLSSAPMNTLILASLNIIFPTTYSYEEFILLSEGMLTIDECSMENNKNSNLELKSRIVYIQNGICHFDSLKIYNQVFGATSGLVKASGGELVIVSCEIDGCSSINGILGGIDGGSLMVNKSTITECEVSEGSVLEWKNCKNIEFNNGCKFCKCESMSSNGGFLNCVIGEDEKFSIGNCKIEECSSFATEGRGGGVWMKLLNDCTNQFKFSYGTEFFRNFAAIGKDVYVECKELNESIKNSRFTLALTDSFGYEIVDMKGRDDVLTKDKDINLLLFLVKYKGNTIYLSSNGMDINGCGELSLECKSFWTGYQNCINEEGKKIIKICDFSAISDTFDASNCSIESTDINQSR
ncbi:uncharacterized protein MONOS_5113 [Monocercomonoides exilis]|uniref:uncharacterized protein n=1 Tax=Monocercomonoides exilis TaxID=2049356 RepID=UPI003559B5B2|nr:hypothetical protein MONOS_5113 [Monocercomonoides exilis]|eukprot:MONOS_5113.1-p1 / transcript=MONOS_5113.1 / gene=MONOS_5113 / organism=Monocercomonoides_exilis_PA203 / gene_product=unspecified product / transcript_product=unspecified product / location=Mono_scaffold00145:55735-58554(-) / protein_length=940 / sequence_SO=supercontig / SO=protein_coding / is_pseudo=false